MHVLTAPGWGSIFKGVFATVFSVAAAAAAFGFLTERLAEPRDRDRIVRWLERDPDKFVKCSVRVALEPGDDSVADETQRVERDAIVLADVRGEGLPVVVFEGGAGETGADFCRVQE